MSPPGSVRGLLVVVPARDEEALLGRCLQSVNQAVDVVRTSYPDVAAAVVVVADRCLDRTPDVARSAGAHVVHIDAGAVGTARRAGVEAGVLLLPTAPTDQTWIASTDADTQVPPNWLQHQLDLAGQGIGLVIGRAVPDRRDLDAKTWAHWHARHTAFAVGAHVHGANLGFRLDDYRAAGGWPRVSEHEDRRLVDALLTAGVPAAAGLEVISSGRVDGRVQGGFSGYLRTMLEPTGTDEEG